MSIIIGLYLPNALWIVLFKVGIVIRKQMVLLTKTIFVKKYKKIKNIFVNCLLLTDCI